MELNEQQRLAAEHNGDHALVLAGAGTGKTSTIVGRLKYLISSGVDPRRILLLTFTRRAAKEMLNRTESQIGPVANRIQAGTFHSFCLVTMRQLPQLFQLEGANVLDREDQTQVMKLARAMHVKKGIRLPQADSLVSLLSFARNTNQPIRTYLEKTAEIDSETAGDVLAIFHSYTRRKQECAYLDFDDILILVAKGLHQNETCRALIAAQYDHVLVDEMQDTNPLQWLILDGLRERAKLFCVGDDAQSIYKFRGADFANVHFFSERVPGATVFRLSDNYRSTQEILDVSNWLLAQSPLPYKKNLRAVRGSGVRPKLVDCDSDTDEASWISSDILQRHEAGASWKDHMILTRSAWTARATEASLIEKRIPHVVIGGLQLMQSAHVKDLLSLVRAYFNPRDEIAWTRYLTLWPRIGDKSAASAIEALRNCLTPEETLSALASRFGSGAKLLAPFRALHQHYESPSQALTEVSSHLGEVLSARYDRWNMRKKDFDLLSRISSNHRSLAEFVDTYVLDPMIESVVGRDQGHDVVSLITVHSAKGTEAPVCYAIGVQPGVYPHSRSLGNIEDEEEDRRVLYVALTRAQNELIITRNSRAGDLLSPIGSRATAAEGCDYFLDALPPGLVDQETYGFSRSQLGAFSGVRAGVQDLTLDPIVPRK